MSTSNVGRAYNAASNIKKDIWHGHLFSSTREEQVDVFIHTIGIMEILDYFTRMVLGQEPQKQAL